MRRLALAAFALLAACGSKSDKGTSISFDTGDGNGTITADGDRSQANISLPGFSGTFKLPKIQVKADQVDLNGVHLYPGSTVTAMDVASHGDGDDGTAKIDFESPAAPTTVRDWFAPRLKDAGYTLRADGAGLSGKDKDGKPFKLELAPDGAGKARGTILAS
jgi:hypothetical protein